MSLTVRVSLAVLCSYGVAVAEPIVERVRLWEGLHEIELELSFARSRSPAAYALRADPDGQLVTAKEVRSFADAGEPFDIAFVIQDGNADLAGSDIGLALAASAESRVIVISYGDGAKLLSETDARAFSTTALRAPATGTTRRDLAAGVELALDRLTAGGFATRRAVIVVGDGIATTGNAAIPGLQRLRRFAREANISTSALVRWQDGVDHQIHAVAPMTLTATTAAELQVKATSHLHYLADRVIVTFPEEDADGNRIAWDGTTRTLVLNSGGVDVYVDEHTLPRWHADDDSCGIGSRWWLVLLVAGAFVIGFLLWSRRQTTAD
jgi:hypothetical protein